MGDRQFSVQMGDGSRAFIDCYGVDEYEIVVGEQKIRFSWSDRFGPLPLNKRGDPRNLGPRHKFWRAASLWNVQGRRVEDGKAIWHEPKQPVYKHLGGKNYLIIEDGETGWDW